MRRPAPACWRSARPRPAGIENRCKTLRGGFGKRAAASDRRGRALQRHVDPVDRPDDIDGMSAVPFYTLTPARKLEAAGFSHEQAQTTAAALAEVLSDQVATRQDIKDLGSELRELEQRLTIRLGGTPAVSIAAVAALARLLLR